MNNNLLAARFIIGVESTSLTTADNLRLKNRHVVGVILFSRNFENSTQLINLTTNIKSIRSDLLICCDQEGGRVQRFKTDRFSQLSSLYELAQTKDKTNLQQHAKILATELKTHGIDFSFTPVVDLYRAHSRVINSRAFAENESDVILLASNYIDYMHQYQLPSVLKHFPGHGSLIADSHTESVVDQRTLSKIEQTDLLPFTALIKQNKADSIMVAHLLYPNIDADIASNSYFWLSKCLREQLLFQGIIFSDDFGMFAAASTTQNQLLSCKKFFQAGGDVSLLCNEFNAIDDVLSVFSDDRYIANTRFDQRWQNFQKPLQK